MQDRIFNYSSFFSKFPVINLENFILRDLSLSDNQRYFEVLSDPNVAQFLSDEDVPESPYKALEEIKFWGSLFYKKQSIFWAIVEKETNNLIGTVGFNSWNFSSQRAEMSYDLASTHWRRNIMSEVLFHVLTFAFTKMCINRIEAKTMTHNVASAALLLKMGFKKEGVLKSYRKVRSKFIDVDLYSLLREEWSAAKNKGIA
ncbi:MAG: Protein N-acetyltransferase, RimJ/RimL family [Candidatus Midichloria mitochondrii]|uniref:Ribosomal-protein-alanine acetyltransferase n=1 Tax=Midichloria mitochondrii (strain IricVA) TaxID=696127 RepID=F7XW01_MIDMI|nr:GNAT family protein [Candidatus Midichloria mitochondrii]AEI88850.1 ribosomal-protein-alanine acetyltransferase [Candidatus Midichloria mitochondrii IricVA]MDJ1256535.1 GNAT family N-acetyltransferase [Candidatus Midichloria mitochondrii]MDJ1288250.1 GNAT family N-acetyltransferase [Candidatus Midichloria mitochondrii]MDJ1299087.1 GNAT family N-acetyltransferase [Candidatus Midichloria mitochondrii]MDJ1313255.1 GNAT family N-acetyltransferase [Candidatus Midichloria mitochondrii]